MMMMMMMTTIHAFAINRAHQVPNPLLSTLLVSTHFYFVQL